MNEENQIKKYSIKDLQDFAVMMRNEGYMVGQNYQEPSKGSLKLWEGVNSKIDGLDKKITRICDCLFGVEGDDQSGVVRTVDRIECHAKETNGRVNKLELWQAGVIAVSAILSISVPTLAWYFVNKFDTLNTEVLTHIASDTKEFNNLK